MLKLNIGEISIRDFKEITAIETKAKLPTENKKAVPTIGFLKQIVQYFDKFKGRTISETQAYYAWLAMYFFRESEAEKQKINAEVSYWFGLNPLKLKPSEIFGFHSNIPRVRAQKQIVEHKYDATDFESVYNLFLVAFDDEDLAVKARNESIKNQMKHEGR